MYNRQAYLIKKIKKHLIIKRYLKIICIACLGVGFLIFSFYGLKTNEHVMRFIAIKSPEEFEKVMTNPRIKFEYSNNEFYDIKAVKAVYKNDNDILLSDVYAKGVSGNIKAGKLLIKSNGNDLYFSDNPVLIIEQSRQSN